MTFYFGWIGNKRKEINTITKHVNLNKYEYFVEPFGGSCSISRWVYEKTGKKCLVSDNDNALVFFCNNFYKYDKEVIKIVKELIKTVKNKDDYYKVIDFKGENNIKIYLAKILLYHSYYAITKGRYPNGGRNPPTYQELEKNMGKIHEFFKNNPYKHEDYKTVLEKHKNNEKCLVILDPPYIFSHNLDYMKASVDWGYLYDFFKSCKCDFIMVVNQDFFMQLAYKDWLKEIYGKKYEITKRKINHCIYSNIKEKNIFCECGEYINNPYDHEQSKKHKKNIFKLLNI